MIIHYFDVNSVIVASLIINFKKDCDHFGVDNMINNTIFMSQHWLMSRQMKGKPFNVFHKYLHQTRSLHCLVTESLTHSLLLLTLE